ncbi:MAG: 6,7-dimethyl-8-ribityllumazine synthase [Aquabacterium sp.]
MNQTSPVSRAGSSGRAKPTRATAGRRRAAARVPPRRWRIAIVHAAWHADIVARSRDAAQAALIEGGVAAADIRCIEVPGAFEIPLHAQALAASGEVDAVIACALVVNGGIYRHEFVAAAVIDGLMRVQLDSAVPVFSAVLTPRDFHEHAEHQAFFSEHFVKKGREVAGACLQTLQSLAQLAA